MLLHGYTGQKDILVGTLTAGRSRADLAHLMGYFVNPVVLRADLTGNPDFPTYLERVRRIVLDALAHQDYPFAALVEHLQPVRDPSRSPLFQVVFVLQQAQLLKEEGLTAFALGAPGASLTVGGMRLEVLELAQRIAQFDLTLTVGEVEGGLAASFEYNADLFLDCTIAQMARHLQNILQGIATAPTCPVLASTFLSEEEQGRLLLDWNGQPVVIPRELCVSDLFSAQVARTPDRVALIHGDRRLTYHELDLAAEGLARHLRGLGVGPEAMVGICLERSPEMMVAILGVLKAGGAYVPLDPSYPKERLAYIMTEARVPVLLTREGRRAGLPGGNYHVVCLDSPGEEAAAGNRAAPVRRRGEPRLFGIHIRFDGAAKGGSAGEQEPRQFDCLLQSFVPDRDRRQGHALDRCFLGQLCGGDPADPLCGRSACPAGGRRGLRPGRAGVARYRACGDHHQLRPLVDRQPQCLAWPPAQTAAHPQRG